MFLLPIKIGKSDVLILQIYYISKSRKRDLFATKIGKEIEKHDFYQGGGPLNGWGKVNLRGDGLDTMDDTITISLIKTTKVFLHKSDIPLLTLRIVFSR